MSCIYFHSPSGTVDLRGSERAYMGGICSSLLAMALQLHHDWYSSTEADPLMSLAPDYVRTMPFEQRRRAFDTFIRVGDGKFTGTDVDPFTASLNTAIDVGNEPIRLMARLHGQCEIHAWVDGPHRAWLAGIIEDGRDLKIYRDDMGWEGVITLLKARDDEPVVTSYSVCEQFPSRVVLSMGDEFYDLPKEEQWRLGIEWLSGENGKGLQMEPEGWEEFFFHDGTNGFELLEIARQRIKS